MSRFDLRSLTDEELQAELARREVIAEARRLELRKQREVDVVCPQCGGKTTVRYYNLRVAAGEEDGIKDCDLCRGEGVITAERA